MPSAPDDYYLFSIQVEFIFDIYLHIGYLVKNIRNIYAK
jgi:hypothetical protein